MGWFGEWSRYIVRACTYATFGLVLSAVPLSASLAKNAPRVVSMHHCMDQYVMDLADPEQIISLSNVSQRPSVSFKADYAIAHQFGRNRGTAEEILPLKPDVVFAGFYWIEAQNLLKRFGVRVEKFITPKSLDALRGQIRRAAKLLGQEERGENLLHRIDRELGRTLTALASGKPRAGIMYSGGYTQGQGTYFNDMLEKSGYTNIAAEAGMKGFGRLSLERIVTIQPEMLFVDKDSRKRADRIASGFMAHPALRRAIPQTQREHLPTKFWVCGGESTIAALKMLRKAHEAYERAVP